MKINILMFLLCNALITNVFKNRAQEEVENTIPAMPHFGMLFHRFWLPIWACKVSKIVAKTRPQEKVANGASAGHRRLAGALAYDGPPPRDKIVFHQNGWFSTWLVGFPTKQMINGWFSTENGWFSNWRGNGRKKRWTGQAEQWMEGARQ